MKYAFYFSRNSNAGFLLVEADSLEGARIKMIRGWLDHHAVFSSPPSEGEEEDYDEDSGHMVVFVLNGMRPLEFDGLTSVINGSIRYPSMLVALQKGVIEEVKQEVVYVCCDG